VNLEPIFHIQKVKWHEWLVFTDEWTEGKVKTG
jgi:hypothetical protein